MNKPTVSIGIPAYNEEANIKNLLDSLLSQKADNFELKEIIVVSDGSSDKTATEAKLAGNNLIKVLDDGKRKGQAMRQNEILDVFQGDILVLLNADVLPSSEDFIEKIVKEFKKDSMIGIVGPEIVPVKASNYFEKIINYSVSLKKSIYRKINHGNNLYLCCGAARGLSRSFAKTIKWPPSISEDAYSYLECINKKFKFSYLPSAVAYYKSPDNFIDHVKQSTRFFNGHHVMYNYFPKDFTDKYYAIPFKIKVKSVITFFFKDPIKFTAYLIIVLICKVKAIGHKNKSSIWDPASSSKTLIT